jgi:L-aminopeptidase/D-esterase-like protein
VVVATDADVGRGMLTRLATMGHDGMARALDPVHTLADGDVVFALSTGAVPLPPEGSGFASGRAWRAAHLALQAAAARVCAAAIRDGAAAARAADGARPV